MRCAQSGPIIQVKEERKIPFFNENCCDMKYYSDHEDAYYPDRCSDHNKQFMKWKRIKATKIKFRSKFNRRRHKFIKMLTFGLPGNKITTNKKIEKIKYRSDEWKLECNRDHEIWRKELRSRFNKLRRDPWWKKHVDGGIWFYETVLKEIDQVNQMTFDEQVNKMNDVRMTIHPHFHCMILGPRNLAGQDRNFQELNDLFEKHGLGRPSVSVAKDKKGNAVNASLAKSLWYLTNYLKKQEHAEGINRGSFGIFNQRT